MFFTVIKLMDGRKLTGGVLLSSGKMNGSGGDVTTAGAIFQDNIDFFSGSTGDTRRDWRIVISDKDKSKNALLVEYKDASGEWKIAHVYFANG